MVHSNTVEIVGVGPVLFERSKKAKHLNISVKPFTGVRVAVPDGLSFQKAEEFVYTKKAWIQKHLVRMKQYEKNDNTNSAISDDIDRAKAKRKLTRRLKYLAAKHGFTYNRVFIRNQKTRWGSCSQKNNISLNMKVVRLPEELIDYVILHELAHTRIKKHNDDFWVMMNKLVGDGKVKAASLREYGIGYL
ncbi:M48 family metallopeptidase [Chloroflexota bacterium]